MKKNDIIKKLKIHSNLLIINYNNECDFTYNLRFPYFFKVRTKNNRLYVTDRINFLKIFITFKSSGHLINFNYNEIKDICIVKLIDIQENE